MKTKRNVGFRLLRISIAGFLGLIFAMPSDSWAFPRHGEVIRTLPHGHMPVWVGRSHYYYHGGAFYRRGPRGFVVARAPIGAVVAYLPFGFTTVMVGGFPYYYYGGVYYRSVPTGYMVVEPPPAVLAAPPPPPVGAGPPLAQQSQIMVTADLLNVRSAPGLNEPVVLQVRKGDLLVVQGSTEGWWYVQLPNNTYGWVQSQFTSAPQGAPSGVPASG